MDKEDNSVITPLVKLNKFDISDYEVPGHGSISISDLGPKWVKFDVDKVIFNVNDNTLYTYSDKEHFIPMPNEITFKYPNSVFKYKLVKE